MNNRPIYKATAGIALIVASFPLLAAGPIFTTNTNVTHNPPDGNPDFVLLDRDPNETDWNLEGDEPCNECFGISYDDAPAAQRTPFVIENGTANNLLYLDSLERIGINTNVPGYTVDAVGNRIRLRNGAKRIMMRADGSETDLEATGADLFLRSSTAGNNIVMNPYGNDGNVGVGTTTPIAKLHVVGTSNAQILVENTSAAAGADRVMYRLADASNNKIRFAITGAVHSWTFDNAGPAFQINKVGTGVNEFSFEDDGDSRQRGRSYATNHINTSSREAKTDFTPVDHQVVLDKLLAMPVSEWRYKSETSDSKHIGPVAEDFQASFGLSDGKHISTVDASGVALAAIKGLSQRFEEEVSKIEKEVSKKDAKIEALRKANDDLQERLAKLEQLLISQDPVANR